MGASGSAVTSGNVDLDSVAKNAIVQTAVQRMIDAAVEKAANNMVEREKTKFRELEKNVVQEIQTLERTVSNLRQQKTATEKKLQEMERLEACVDKLEKRVKALEISINTTLETILPEAKALVESLLQKSTSTAEMPTQTDGADSPSSESVNVTIQSPTSSVVASTSTDPGTIDVAQISESTSSATTVSESTTSATTISTISPNPEFPLTSTARSPLSSALPTSSPPCTAFSESTPIVPTATAFSSPLSPVSPSACPSTSSVVAPTCPAPRGKTASQGAPRKSVAMLHRAVCECRPDVVYRLLKDGVNINVRGREGMTALHLAAKRGDAVMLDSLLRFGALVYLGDRGHWQALHWAACRDRVGSCVAMLVDAGAALDARSRPAGDTPLHVAAGEGNDVAAMALLRAGAKAWLRNNDGLTPLDLAMSNEKMRRLLDPPHHS